MTVNSIREPERDLPVRGEYDVVVLGGGPAGIAAAASAAARGRKTLLVERYGFLGGMGTAAGVTSFCGLHANVHGEHRQVVHGIADELLARLDRLGGLNKPHVSFGKIQAQAYDTAAYKCAADDLLLGHGADILFHALGAGVVMDPDDTIRALIVETKSGRAAVIGRIFIDCSGDGDLAAWAGAPFEHGDGHGGMLYPTMMFRLNGVDPAAAGEAWTTIPALMDEAERRGVKFPRQGAIVRPQKNPIEWRVNVTQMKKPDGSALDGTNADELSAGEIEGRRQVMQFFEFLKREAPGFANSYVVDTPPQLGIRETRRITGPYQLSGEDVLSCASFCRHHRRQRLADRSAQSRPRRMAVAADPGVARLLPDALPYDSAAEGEEPSRRRPLRFDDARGPVGGTGQRRLFRHGPGGGQRRAFGACRQFRAG